MLISSYNKQAWGDTLIVIVAEDTKGQKIEQQGDIVQLTATDGHLLGYNFLHVSQWVPDITGNGQIQLTGQQVNALNAALRQAGFADLLALDDTARFVIGKVVKLEDHPDSDHLHVAQVDLGTTTQQIVCGAPNVALGETVVAALPGAMMPDGKIIWPGKLRGVESDGMLCSARELAIPGAPAKRGILLMPDSFAPGTKFDPSEAARVVAAQAV